MIAACFGDPIGLLMDVPGVAGLCCQEALYYLFGHGAVRWSLRKPGQAELYPVTDMSNCLHASFLGDYVPDVFGGSGLLTIKFLAGWVWLPEPRFLFGYPDGRIVWMK